MLSFILVVMIIFSPSRVEQEKGLEESSTSLSPLFSLSADNWVCFVRFILYVPSVVSCTHLEVGEVWDWENVRLHVLSSMTLL